MPSLNEYMQQLQRFVRDPSQKLFNPEDLIHYINRARREVTMRAQCLRMVTPVSGSVVDCQITSGGSGYTNPVVVISPPDYPNSQVGNPVGAQATGVAQMTGGVITSVQITFGGYGYFQPTISIVDPTGTGFAGTLDLTWFNQTTAGQEMYTFSGINLSAFPGYKSVYMVKSVAMIYANYRYTLPKYSWTTYQSSIRQYPFQYVYVPTIYSQLGQGVSGSLYFYPIPSQPYQFEWDCFCLPSDLVDDQSVEAVPEPWTDAVPYFAAHLAFTELQNMNSSRMMLELYNDFVKRYSSYVRPGHAVNPYGRF